MNLLKIAVAYLALCLFFSLSSFGDVYYFDAKGKPIGVITIDAVLEPVSSSGISSVRYREGEIPPGMNSYKFLPGHNYIVVANANASDRQKTVPGFIWVTIEPESTTVTTQGTNSVTVTVSATTSTVFSDPIYVNGDFNG